MRGSHSSPLSPCIELICFLEGAIAWISPCFVLGESNQTLPPYLQLPFSIPLRLSFNATEQSVWRILAFISNSAFFKVMTAGTKTDNMIFNLPSSLKLTFRAFGNELYEIVKRVCKGVTDPG
ncbi:hypothetical protein EGR_01917 [Echinococcus granulosus]|uniref:Uncharacterized protein n=1 Tax=Echinococcus granulosus TaxID=6210 RepID=W6UPE4_ECHGR|nr:hypothetical protein EGR_01917 [Echinococcus granulosus]EUB63113.1 hypothetical protein EGR_01917 [Echinococcus granulosus]